MEGSPEAGAALREEVGAGLAAVWRRATTRLAADGSTRPHASWSALRARRIAAGGGCSNEPAGLPDSDTTADTRSVSALASAVARLSSSRRVVPEEALPSLPIAKDCSVVGTEGRARRADDQPKTLRLSTILAFK
eukprot:scaffold40046_cov29-Tisochrysis_lutea.AAC.3